MGDLVDELLARYINETGTQLPISRLQEGWYLFGTRKIYAKVMNGRLVVRVGGGFSNLKEFIEIYQQQEIEKINDLISRNEWNFEALVAFYKNEIGQNPGQTMGGPKLSARASSAAARASPRRGSQKF